MSAIIGRRAEQQDAGRLVAVKLPGGRSALLMIVADGMGGHAGGAEASRIAIDVFGRTFGAASNVPTSRRLQEALHAANDAIGKRAKADSGLRGMGCTLVAAVLDGRRLTWISVGDTLLVAAKGARLRRLNADHSLGAILDERAERGEISVEEALANPQRHILRAAVTGDRIGLIDENDATLEPGELLVAATDGVLTLPWQRLAALLGPVGSPAVAIQSVLDAITEDMPDDQDNTTLAAVRVSNRASPAPRKAIMRRRRSWRTLAVVLAFLVVLASIALLALAVWQGGEASPAPVPGPSSAPPPPAGPGEAPHAPTPAAPGRVNNSRTATPGPGPASGRVVETSKPATTKPTSSTRSGPEAARTTKPKPLATTTPAPVSTVPVPTAPPAAGASQDPIGDLVLERAHPPAGPARTTAVPPK
jgi:serine/threonine protein phosphatase PrpC